MAKNKNEKFLIQSLDTIMSDRFGRYSKYVIQGRALPDVRDGLKPVQRRIIFAMNELGLFSDRAFKKSARIVGEVIGKYHPHGDSSIYEAMVRMGQDWKMNVPLIEMHGNKGSIDDDPAAAMRYTETRLAKITKTLLTGIKKDTVSFAPNFDDSETEPTVLPALMPNLLVNGARGIASGYATEIPPHNLGEILDAIIAKIKSPNARLETLLQYVKGPDFPTGGEVQGYDGFYSAMERGSGRVVIRSKYTFHESKKNPYIEITEIPYGVVKSKLVRDIDEKRFNKSISGIKDIRDETDRNGISIIIELDPGANHEQIINYLLSKTEMQVYYNYNNVGIVDNAPKLLGLIELIDAYLKHQKDVQRKGLKFDLNKDSIRLEIVQGLIKVTTIAEEVIDVIRNAEGSKQGVVKALVENFNFTELQANAIADLKLYRLSKTDQTIYLNEEKELIQRINKYKNLLNDDEAFNKYLIDQLREFKKQFATPRKTIMTREVEKVDYKMEELIKHEDVWIGVTRQGYIKRMSNRVYEANDFSTYGLKDDDSIVYFHRINTSDKLLVFTNKGRYVIVPTHLIDEIKWKQVGKHINDFAAIDLDENIIDAVSVNDFDLNIALVIATKQGKVKRTKISDFSASRISKPLTAMKLEENDQVIGIRPTNGLSQIILVNNEGKAVKYSENQISYQGTKSKGVRGISLSNNSYVSNLAVANNKDTIGLVSQRGALKRIHVSEIIPTSKTTQGKELFRNLKTKAHIVIDSRVVKPNTLISFRTKDLFVIHDFKDTPITSPSEGFSNPTVKNVIDARILMFNRIHGDTSLLKNIENISEEDRFSDAEETIDKISQLSIDDILKGL